MRVSLEVARSYFSFQQHKRASLESQAISVSSNWFCGGTVPGDDTPTSSYDIKQTIKYPKFLWFCSSAHVSLCLGSTVLTGTQEEKAACLQVNIGNGSFGCDAEAKCWLCESVQRALCWVTQSGEPRLMWVLGVFTSPQTSLGTSASREVLQFMIPQTGRRQYDQQHCAVYYHPSAAASAKRGTIGIEKWTDTYHPAVWKRPLHFSQMFSLSWHSACH